MIACLAFVCVHKRDCVQKNCLGECLHVDYVCGFGPCDCVIPFLVSALHYAFLQSQKCQTVKEVVLLSKMS